MPCCKFAGRCPGRVRSPSVSKFVDIICSCSNYLSWYSFFFGLCNIVCLVLVLLGLVWSCSWSCLGLVWSCCVNKVSKCRYTCLTAGSNGVLPRSPPGNAVVTHFFGSGAFIFFFSFVRALFFRSSFFRQKSAEVTQNDPKMEVKRVPEACFFRSWANLVFEQPSDEFAWF